jgi:hypothetical protein
MVNQPDRYQPLIPDREGDDEKDVFLFLGFASFLAQGLEAELVNIAVAVAMDEHKSFSNQEIDTMFDDHEMRTLGSLFSRVRTHLVLEADAERAIRLAVNERNRLAHHFFRQHSTHFLTSTGRRRMIDDLQSLARTLLDADKIATTLSDQLWTLRGVSWELRESLALKILNDAERRDHE